MYNILTNKIMEDEFLKQEIFEALLNNVEVNGDFEPEHMEEVPSVTFVAEAKGYRMLFERYRDEVSIEGLTYENEFIDDLLTEEQTEALDRKMDEVLDYWLADKRAEYKEYLREVKLGYAI